MQWMKFRIIRAKYVFDAINSKSNNISNCIVGIGVGTSEYHYDSRKLFGEASGVKIPFRDNGCVYSEI